MIVRDQPEAVAAAVSRLLWGDDRGFGPCKAIAFCAPDGTFEAGIVYHNWQPDNGVIEISAASVNRKWLNRDKLQEVFRYPFGQLGCRMVVARIGEHNARARRIWRAFGATETIIPELRNPAEGECVYTLTAPQWAQSKLSEVSHGQAPFSDPA